MTDHEGSIRDLATYDSQNDITTVANHRIYDSYGNLTSETNSAVDCLFGYTGRLHDSATGLQNNLNRWYDSSTGRWLSRDPVGFNAGDSNLYRYCSNDPLDYTDPTGFCRKTNTNTRKPGGYRGGWWNPFNWHRGLYTGDPNSPDDEYDAAKKAAGEDLKENVPRAQEQFQALQTIDPTPLSSLMDAGCDYTMGRDEEAKDKLKNAALNAATSKLGKYGKGGNVSSQLGSQSAQTAKRVEDGMKKGKSLTNKQAIDRLRRGADIYASSKKMAKQLQDKASGGSIKDQAHDSGYYDHYHGKNRDTGHAFYGTAKEE